jgi:organic radical activating enzyme
MFGQNPLREQELTSDGSLAVTEIFHTIQGEGPHAGVPAVFVRLMGCNLRCHFCDTEFEKLWVDGPMAPAAVIADIQRLRGKHTWLVVLTGGEPLRQNVVPLIAGLVMVGFRVQIETAGTLWQPGLEQLIESGEVDIVVSPKTGRVHAQVAALARAWKYIVRAGEQHPDDGLPNVGTQMPRAVKVRLARRPPESNREIYVQPCDEYNPEKNKANTQAAVECSLKYGYRLCLQTHKIAGLP